MYFGDVEIQNFMAIGQAKLNLANRGLLLIQGENLEDESQDSNGAGKSTVADAISWCLFGVTARGVSPNDVVNRTAKKECFVKVPIFDGDEEYLVARYRKSKEFKNSVQLMKREGDGFVSLTQGTDKLTQEKIEQILGCNHEIFSASVYSAQEAQVDLPSMTDKELKYIVEEAAGITRLQKAEVVARERLRDAKAEYTAEQARFESAKQNVGYFEQQLSQAAEQADNFDSEKSNRLSAMARSIEQDVEKIKAQVASLERVDVKAVEQEVAELQEKDRELAKKHQDDVYEAGAAKLAAEQKEQSLASSLNALANHARRLDSECKGSESLIGTPCRECGKAYEEHDMADAIAHRKKQLVDVMGEISDKKPELIQLRENLARAIEAFNKIRAQQPETSAAKIAELLQSKHRYQTEVSRIKQLKAHIESSKERLEQMRDEPNPHLSVVASLEERIVEAKSRVAECEKRLEMLDEKVQVAEAVAQVYGRTGVRAHILDTVTPYLNERTANYLAQLSDGNIIASWQTLSTKANGELTEKFTIDVKSKTGGDSFKALSGGEKRKVRLSTNLALQDLVSTRATKNIDLYIGDEIDHALDTAGLERLMNVLDERARSHGTVMVISHNELRDWIRQQVTVVKKDGYSTLVE